MDMKKKSRIETEAVWRLRCEFRETHEINTDIVGMVLDLETGETAVRAMDFKGQAPLSMRGSAMAPLRNGMRIYRFATAAESNGDRPLQVALVDIASSDEGENDLVRLTFFDFNNPSAEQRTVYYDIMFGGLEVDGDGNLIEMPGDLERVDG